MGYKYYPIINAFILPYEDTKSQNYKYPLIQSHFESVAEADI